MNKLFIVILLAATICSCSDDIPTVNLGIDDNYRIARMQKLPLHPALSGKEYRWTVNGKEMSDSRDYIFISPDEGVYDVCIEIIDPDTPFEFSFTVTVMHEEVEYSPYISRVYEYCPAPGQFVNEMPRYEDGDTYDDILKKAEESISGTNDVMISLGGFGGYVTFGFDHTVVDRPGQADLRIWGNCFYELTDPSKRGGSAEPGIVMVSFDSNCNGLPDDQWYELAGSEYDSPETIRNYSITYSRPDENAQPVADNTSMLSDIYYIPWTDNQGQAGYMPKNIFHNQDYFPKWIDAQSISFQGSCLAPNAKDLSGNGSYFVLYSYDWGYVDNHPNDYSDLNSFDIANARDSQGRSVKLPGVDFVRVYTGINQYCGWLGETSTEICRAQDLSISPAPLVPEDPISQQSSIFQQSLN